MSASAIVMAVIGIVIIWGGLIASVLRARNASKES
ncbi:MULTISPECIES: methionine/alanine import family NSS transporter small subunit [Gracilibacillus]|nr:MULTISPECIES: methionine/alanine import family NSS transporter small subunit [Gracilibacillus]